MWCKDNNLSLYMIKTKEMIVDYRKTDDREHPHSHQLGTRGES